MLNHLKSLFFKQGNNITISELEQLLDSHVPLQLIDVRTTQEYRQGHIKQAINIPLPQLASAKFRAEQPIYLICQSGRRSKMAQQELNKQGITATNITGGMSKWTRKTTGGH